MTDFLIQSTIAMAALLSLYTIFFAKEKMHRFNRFYLLGALVFSIALPFVTIKVYYDVETAQPIAITQDTIVKELPLVVPQYAPQAIGETTVDYTPYLIWGLYIVVTAFFAFRFIKNITQLKASVKNNTNIYLGKAVIVLTENITQPYTFLNYIFINKEEYEKCAVEDEVLIHELAHVKQKHTYDILFVELLKTVLWFNPMLHFYKKSIQFNHEFLADENVIKQNNNIISYQQLLVKRGTPSVNHQLASSLNFKLTKKRLLMMNKSTSKTRVVLIKLLVLPILTGLVYLIAVKSIAQEKQLPQQQQETTVKAEVKTNEDEARDRYYAGVKLILKNCRREVIIDKQYEDLTLDEQRNYVFIVPKPAVKKSPTEAQFKDYKNKTKYAIWIDDKNVDNTVLNKYKTSDFASVRGSSIYKNARTKQHPQPYQLTLYTHTYFDKNLKNRHLKYDGDTIELILPKETRTKEQIEQDKKQGKLMKTVAMDSIEKIDYKPKADDYFAGVRFIYYKTGQQTKDSIKGKDPFFNKIYEDITEEEKKAEPLMFTTPSTEKPVPPTQRELNLGKNKNNCVVWIDGKEVDNSALAKYKPTDFASFASLVILKNGRTKEHPQPYWYVLKTKDYYKKNELHKVPARYGEAEKHLFKKIIKA